MRAGAGRGGAEAPFAHSLGDVMLRRPFYRLGVVGARGYVGETSDCRRRDSKGAVEEGNGFGAGDGGIGVEAFAALTSVGKRKN